jgi:ribonuclease BN (tRNA processing enzyme)
VDLEFIGIGSALNAVDGNTAAFFIEKQELFLIDCGGTVVAELDRRHIFCGVKAVNVIITHCHCDHIGSLADLIYYAKYRHGGVPVNILWDSENEEAKQRLAQVLGYLDYFQVIKHCKLVETTKYHGYGELVDIHLLPTTHTPKLHCVSVVLRTRDKDIFYSGDSNTLETLKAAEEKYGEMDHIYFETTLKDSPLHLHLERLAEFFPLQKRSKVTVMHLEGEEVKMRAWQLGFQLPAY